MTFRVHVSFNFLGSKNTLEHYHHPQDLYFCKNIDLHNFLLKLGESNNLKDQIEDNRAISTET